LKKNSAKIPLNSVKKIIKNTVKQKTEFELLLEKELKIFEKKVETEDEVKILQEKLSDLSIYK